MPAPLRLAVFSLVAASSLAVAVPSFGASTPGSAGAKLAAKCQQTVAKATATFLAGRAKRIAACNRGVLACLQTKPGDAKCLPKAAAGCEKQLGAAGAPDALAVTAEAAVVKACGALPLDDLLDPAVLGFANAAVTCGDVGVDPLAGAADVARCLRLVHARLADQAAGIELPRAAELAAQGGVDASRVPSLPLFGGCGACAVPPPGGKAVAACAAGLGKAGAGFLASTRKALDKCAAAFLKCAHEKPDDAKCTAKAAATCRKLPAGLEKARAKVEAAAAKSCGGVELATLENPSGINLGALACACGQVGVEPVLGLADYAACLARHHECELAALVPTLVPRLDGLLADAGIALGDLLCPPPASASVVAKARNAPRPFVPAFGNIHKYVKTALPASVKSGVKSPTPTRGVAPRIGAPTSSKCTPAPGKSCLFRLPIHKKPFASLTRAAETRGVMEPPKLVLSVRRGDGEFVEDYFELPLGDTSVDSEVELDVAYADDLASCEFELALTVVEDGVVADYAAIEQTPHVPPANDSCDAAQGIESSLFETRDTTAANFTDEDLVPTCAVSGASRSLWYEFTAPAGGTLFLTTSGSDHATAIAVYTGGCRGTEVACGANAPEETVQLAVTQGITYSIQVSAVGDPPLTSVVRFGAVFVPGLTGAPATISNLVMGTPQVNTAACDFGTGAPWTAFPMTMSYSDPSGNVKNVTTFPIVLLHFEPSQRNEAAAIPALPVITGDGFTGTISFAPCVRFDTDTVVSFKPQILTLGGNLSNQLSSALPKPPGAN
jgi:hypothetical protein